ncbi:hypothetical protein [Streptomyces sp. NPDC059649]
MSEFAAARETAAALSGVLKRAARDAAGKEKGREKGAFGPYRIR